MRFVSANIQNFKLLKDVRLEFSVERDRPLTVIRAANGSGKTSVLYALLWGLYGPQGLPSGAQEVRLTSSAAPVDVAVEIQVTVEFERVEGMDTTAYTVIRTMLETPKGKDLFVRGPNSLRLYRRTPAGHDPVPNPETVIAKFLPPGLKSVFFTDGDDVQRFISSEGTHGRQKRVHDAIKVLLGLDKMRIAGKDLENVVATCRKAAASSAGANLQALDVKLADLSKELTRTDDELTKERDRRQQIGLDRDGADKELAELKSIGDIDAINAQINRLEKSLGDFENRDQALLEEMRTAISAQGASWALAGSKLLEGFGILDRLAVRGIIPGTSLEVLVDRLDLKRCICNAELSDGSAARQSVELLLAEQRKVSAHHGHQTQIFHSARPAREEYLRTCEGKSDFVSQRKRQLADFAGNRDKLKQTGADLEVLREKRASIDDEQVRRLSDRRSNAQSKFTDASELIGKLQTQLAGFQERHSLAKDEYETAEKAARVSKSLVTTREVADDLCKLIERTLKVLEGEHVCQVSSRMNNMFMEIVGSDPALSSAVFRGVKVTDGFDIVVQTAGDGQLDHDFEVNGASKRALTLSFIWALMEVAGQVAPRIIDTPLGMTAEGVKTRLVDVITRPPTGQSPPYQVVLFLTRSEIAGIETIIDQRVGKSQTLSCNKDYPLELVHNWHCDHPVVRVCGCSVKQFCTVCERRYDDAHALVERVEQHA